MRMKHLHQICTWDAAFAFQTLLEAFDRQLHRNLIKFLKRIFIVFWVCRAQDERKKRNYADFWTLPPVIEPYRVVLSDIRDRLWQTRDVLHQCLMNTSINVKEVRRGLSNALGKQPSQRCCMWRVVRLVQQP